MYSRRRTNKTAEKIGACLEIATSNPDFSGSYMVLKRCYLHASARETNPSRADIAKVTGDSTTLYCREDPTPPPWDTNAYTYQTLPGQ